ncbi:MAG: amino acid permease [Ferruginibacter sp.]|nr:amino acid permease [Cytophagales bacterium]
MSNLASASAEKLVRGIGRWDFVALIVNITVGAGILGLPSKVYGLVGPYSLLAFVACAGVVLLLILCFAEVGSRFRGTGGPYLYALAAFGPLVGFEAGWLLWLSRLFSFASVGNLLVSYAAYFWPAAASGGGRAGLLTGVILSLAGLNFAGIRPATVVNNVITVSKLLVLLLFVGIGLFFVDPRAYAFPPPPAPSSFALSILLLIFAFSGFDVASVPAGEVRQPQRNVPFALFTALGGVTLLYLAIQVVCIGTLPDLAGSERPLADATERFGGPAGAAFLSAGALITVLGTLNVLMLTSSRILFAMAERGQLPPLLATTHPRFRTPGVAIFLTTALLLLLTVAGTFLYALTLSAIIRLFTFATTCAALPRLRHASPAPFRVKAGGVVAAAALLLCGGLLLNSTWQEARDAGIAAAVGLVIYVLYSRKQPLSARKFTG